MLTALYPRRNSLFLNKGKNNVSSMMVIILIISVLKLFYF